MKKNVWIIIYAGILILNLFAIYTGNSNLVMITKPLLIPLLLVYFFISLQKNLSPLKGWIILALFFSWFGDILLMFEARRPVFFLLGLAAFFIAQVFYIIFFHNIRMREYIRGNALLLLIVIVYYSLLINLLSPFLGKLDIPVRIYGVVISFMVMLAMHTLFSRNKPAGWWMTIGAILFVTSDSLLAFNKFYAPFDYAPVLVMLTYGLAQLGIVEGAVKYMHGIRQFDL